MQSFSFVEKVLFYTFVALLIASTIFLLGKLNSSFLVEVPAPGGGITEGVIGTPRFINPLLAISAADRDLTQIVYSGLMKATPDGTLIPDLAEGYVISDDGMTYTFTLRDNVRFHDGSAVTADDVLYTIGLAQNSSVKSPKRANWEGVLAEKVDERTIRFTLAQPYSPFLENTTMGILPQHLWEKTPPEQLPFSTHNVEPVGSGPYRVVNLKRTASGVPQYYRLVAFDHYALGKPFITDIEFRFYANEDELLKALKRGAVQNVNAISPDKAAELENNGRRIETFPLPRVFGVFFNQSEAPLFTNIEVRAALDAAVDKDRIVREVLSGHGVAIDGPIPPGLLKRARASENMPVAARIEQAKDILERNGWELGGETGIYMKETKEEDFLLSFSISTANTPELKRTAELVKENWERMGASVDLKFFDSGSLNNEVIRPRNYDALLFGQIIGRDVDPFAFWHSSQQNDPGLNIALYANITVDNLLEEIRTTFDEKALQNLYEAFAEEVTNDIPAVFIYSPDFIYVLDKDIKGAVLGTVTTPAERFLNVHEWHTRTDKVWKLFDK